VSNVLIHPTARAAEAAADSSVHPTGLVPPHDLDAEGAVLSAVLLDPSALAKIEDFLLPEHFFSEAHRRIYEAAIAVKATGAPVDTTTVGGWLKDRQRLEQVGGGRYIGRILDLSPAVGNIRAHATMLHERWRVRQTMLLCQRAAVYGYDAGDAQPYVDGVVRSLAEIARRVPGAKLDDNFEMLRRIVRGLQEGAKATGERVEGRGIPTGIAGWDEKLLGLFAGQKTTIVAHPGYGKTALAGQLAINVAKVGIEVALFLTEMDREEFGVRELSHLARVDSRRIMKALQEPTLSPDEWSRITFAMSQLEDIKPAIHIFDETSVTVDEIAARVKALQERSTMTRGKPLGLVIVDYIQNLRAPAGYEKRPKHEAIAYATKRLKDLAAELKVPIIELAQAKNNEVDKSKRCRPRPQLGDAAECFWIERSANNVIHLWRPDEDDEKYVKAIIVKQRGGKRNEEIDLRFWGEYSFFEDLPFGPQNSPSRQYADKAPNSRRSHPPEPPPGRFDDDDEPRSLLGDD